MIFRNWVLENFPFLEDDFDALTDYELFSKMMEYVKNQGIKLDELDKYVKTLDIPEEVNKKLDEMVEDGTLAEIINQQIFNQLNTRVTNLEEEVEAIDSSITTEIVTFGDSWTDSAVTEAIWPSVVAEELRLNLHNYGNSGSGYVLPADDLVQTQVNLAINDTSYDHNLVKYVVFQGGINDYRRGVLYDALRTEIVELYNTAKVAFPNAKIIYVNNFQYPYTKEQSIYWYRLQLTLSSYGVLALNQDGFFKERFFLENKYHLTASGQRVYASNIITALSGGQIKNDGVYINFEDNKGYMFVKREDKILNYYILFENLTSSDTIITAVEDLCWNDIFDAQYLGSINISYTPAIIDFDGANNQISLARQDTSKTKICMNGSLCLGID